MTHAPAYEVSEEALAVQLSKIGLGRRYHTRRFEHLEQTDTVRAVVAMYHRDEYLRDVFSGIGLSMQGTTLAHDLFMVLARASLLKGIAVRVINLSVLVNEVQGDTIAAGLLEARALFITPFYRPDYKQPLSDFQKLAVEDFLMDRLDNSIALFTLASGSLEESRAWWSAALIRRMQVVNSELQA